MMSTATLQAPYVFLSYPRTEMVVTKRLEQDLQASGLQVWRDESGIRPGSPDWETAVRDAIDHAYAVVLIASPSVIKSLYVKGELNLAKRYHPHHIYPVWVSGADWTDCVPIDFIYTEYIDMRGEKYKVGLNTLVDVLKKAKEQLSPSQQSTAAYQQGVPSPSPPQLVPKLPSSQQPHQRQTQYPQYQPYPQKPFVRGPAVLPQVPPENALAPRSKPNRAVIFLVAVATLLLIGLVIGLQV